MHNTIPQMGAYYDPQLGCLVHDETPQMGGFLDDAIKAIGGAGSGSLSQLEQGVKSQIQTAIPGAKSAFIDQFLKTPTGQAMVEDAKQGWFDQQKAKIYEAYLSGQATAMQYLKLYKKQILIGLVAVGVAGTAYMLLKKKPSRAAAPAVAANPRRRKRKYHRANRRRR